MGKKPNPFLSAAIETNLNQNVLSKKSPLWLPIYVEYALLFKWEKDNFSSRQSVDPPLDLSVFAETSLRSDF